jgi:DNA-binding NtrC family response regulator
VGVLYLEHRRRKGRFREADIDLLFAFADQAAIALENARLIAENDKKRLALEQANRELQEARERTEELLIARTEALDEAQRQLQRTRVTSKEVALRHGMVGQSEVMQHIFDTIDRLRLIRVPVLIHGESGTGKELVARAIHYGGPDAKAPLISINCGAIPESLLESELFGHVKGAFTGADRARSGVIKRASTGTLLLDEVGAMPSKMQVDLLRVLQDGAVRPVGSEEEQQVDVRFIACSNLPFSELVSTGRFREDLYYRLGVVEIALPPLRERSSDIPLLCDHFLRRFAESSDAQPKQLAKETLRILTSHAFPGNVRQLEHVLLNACVLSESTVINPQDLSLEPSTKSSRVRFAASRVPSAAPAKNGTDKVDTAKHTPVENRTKYREEERQRILQALQEHGWNKVKAARALGIARRTFYRRLHQYGIA